MALETKDIGIRMALGADRRQVLSEVLGDGFRMAAAGVALGLVGAFGLTRLLATQLYQVTATDPVTFVSVSAGLLLVATFACWPAARRAAGVDPMLALRCE